MPSIQQKIDDWFVDLSGDDYLPDQSRYEWTRAEGGNLEDSNIREYASASVTDVIEGANYQQAWADGMDTVANHSDPGQCTVYHVTWGIDNVETRGVGNGDHARALCDAVDTAGADLFMMISHHYFRLTPEEFLDQLRLETIALDSRYGGHHGSIHQKFSVFDLPGAAFGLVGSVDINENRWGQRPHQQTDPERPAEPTHDAGVRIEGNALSDLEWAFVERWNDTSRDNWFGNMDDYDSEVPPVIPTAEEPSDRTSGNGEQRVQVLSTYGANNGYSWEGAWTAWAGYLNAIETATEYIFVEDQYFCPFGNTLGRMWLDDQGLQQYCPIHRLRERIRDGVNVVAVTNRETNSRLLDAKRQVAVRELRDAATEQDSGDFEAAYLSNGTDDVYVHTKMLHCDDEFSLVGSTNINARSLTSDPELSVGIVDENDDPSFTEQYRDDLWTEHSEGAWSSGGVLDTQVLEFIALIRSDTGRLRQFPEVPEEVDYDDDVPWYRRLGENMISEIYGGPPRRELREAGQ